MPFKAGKCRGVHLTRKSDSQIRILGSTKEGHETFVKNHALSFAKIRLRQIAKVKGRFLFFETCCNFSSFHTLL